MTGITITRDMYRTIIGYEFVHVEGIQQVHKVYDRYNKNHGEGMGALRGWLVETFISHTASTICEEKVMVFFPTDDTGSEREKFLRAIL